MAMSMTGYGRGECEFDGRQFTVEIKSVNHRYLEVNVKMPRAFIALEDKIRRTVTTHLSRGKVDVFIQSKATGQKKHQLNVDKDLAIVYYNSVKDLDKLLNITTPVDAIKLLSFPGVIETEEPTEEMEQTWKFLSEAVITALKGLSIMRADEGEKLRSDIHVKLDAITSIVEQVAKRAPIVVENYRTRVTERVSEILKETIIDESRIIQEVAFFSDKANVDEELVRLRSHDAQFRKLVDEKVPVGRKADFLIQEMNREANTIGSKANDLEISRFSVELKAEIEKIREQVQNIE